MSEFHCTTYINLLIFQPFHTFTWCTKFSVVLIWQYQHPFPGSPTRPQPPPLPVTSSEVSLSKSGNRMCSYFTPLLTKPWSISQCSEHSPHSNYSETSNYNNQAHQSNQSRHSNRSHCSNQSCRRNQTCHSKLNHRTNQGCHSKQNHCTSKTCCSTCSCSNHSMAGGTDSDPSLQHLWIFLYHFLYW